MECRPEFWRNVYLIDEVYRTMYALLHGEDSRGEFGFDWKLCVLEDYVKRQV